MKKRHLSMAVAMLFLAGCAQHGMNDLQEYVAEVKARPPTPIDPIPQITQAETFLYVAENRRDPFVPTDVVEDVLGESTEEGPRPDPNRRKEELESFPLDALKMVGTLDRKGRCGPWCRPRRDHTPGEDRELPGAERRAHHSDRRRAGEFGGTYSKWSRRLPGASGVIGIG